MTVWDTSEEGRGATRKHPGSLGADSQTRPPWVGFRATGAPPPVFFESQRLQRRSVGSLLRSTLLVLVSLHPRRIPLFSLPVRGQSRPRGGGRGPTGVEVPAEGLGTLR